MFEKKNEVIVTENGFVRYYSFEVEGVNDKYWAFYSMDGSVWEPIGVANSGKQQVLGAYLRGDFTAEELELELAAMIEMISGQFTRILPTPELTTLVDESAIATAAARGFVVTETIEGENNETE